MGGGNEGKENRNKKIIKRKLILVRRFVIYELRRLPPVKRLGLKVKKMTTNRRKGCEGGGHEI